MIKIPPSTRLLIVGSYPPPFGGVSSFVTELEKGLADLVEQFYVLSFHSNESYIKKSKNTVIHKLPNRPKLFILRALVSSPVKTSILFLKYILNVSKSPKFYTSAFINALIICAIAKKNASTSITIFQTRAGASIPFIKIMIPRTPLFYCVFADPYKDPEFYRVHNDWYREAMVGAQKVFSSSKYCSDVTKKFDTSIKPVVVYAGVDTDRFSPLMSQLESREKLQLPLNTKLVLSLARMEPEMGVVDVLAIAKSVLINTENTCFVIAGAKGSVTPQVEEFAAQSRGRVICRVDVPADYLPDYYSACDVIIAPTVGVHACMGVTVKEAMAAGRPVVVTDSGGLPEAVIHEYTGLIVPLKDSGEVDVPLFANYLSGLLADDSRSEAMGSHSRERAIHLFSAEKTVEVFSAMIVQEKDNR